VSIRASVGRSLAGYRRIAVWGAGSLAAMAMRDWLPRDRVVAVFDRDPGKHGKPFFGLTVSDPDSATLGEYDAVVVCITAYLEAFRNIVARDDAPAYFYIYELAADEQESATELSKLAVDYHRARNRNLLLTILSSPQFLTVVTYRLTRCCLNHALLAPLFYVAVFCHYLVCAFSKIELPYTVKAGPGLFFPHLGGVVINRDTEFGAFVKIYQFTTFGADDSGAVPTVGDFITINPGAVVLGSAHIANHSRIGANATVLGLQCEPGSVLVGTPARAVGSQAVPSRAERSRSGHRQTA
jgi:serine O-acetyltransferase